jgi:hypothetical protein
MSWTSCPSQSSVDGGLRWYWFLLTVGICEHVVSSQSSVDGGLRWKWFTDTNYMSVDELNMLPHLNRPSTENWDDFNFIKRVGHVVSSQSSVDGGLRWYWFLLTIGICEHVVSSQSSVERGLRWKWFTDTNYMSVDELNMLPYLNRPSTGNWDDFNFF